MKPVLENSKPVEETGTKSKEVLKRGQGDDQKKIPETGSDVVQ